MSELQNLKEEIQKLKIQSEKQQKALEYLLNELKDAKEWIKYLMKWNHIPQNLIESVDG